MKKNNHIRLLFSLAIILCTTQMQGMLKTTTGALPGAVQNYFSTAYGYLQNKINGMFPSTPQSRAFSTTPTPSDTPLFEKNDKNVAKLEKAQQKFLTHYRNLPPLEKAQQKFLTRYLPPRIYVKKDPTLTLEKVDPEYKYKLKNEQTDILKKFLKKGGDPNFRINGVPLIVDAARADDLDKVRVLLKYGADPNAQDPEGRNAASEAIDNMKFYDDANAKEILNLLFTYGLDSNAIKNNPGYDTNPLVNAAFRYDERTVEKLLKHKASPKTPTGYGNLTITDFIKKLKDSFTFQRKMRTDIFKRLTEIGKINAHVDKTTKDNLMQIMEDKPKNFMEFLKKHQGPIDIDKELYDQAKTYVNRFTNLEKKADAIYQLLVKYGGEKKEEKQLKE